MLDTYIPSEIGGYLEYRPFEILKWTHFTNNEPFLLLNLKYASYNNKIMFNEFGIF